MYDIFGVLFLLFLFYQDQVNAKAKGKAGKTKAKGGVAHVTVLHPIRSV